MPKYAVNPYSKAHLEQAMPKLMGGDVRLLNAAPAEILTDKTVVAFGIPFDCGMFQNQGVRKAPQAVRAISHQYASSMYPHDEIFEPTAVADAGNLVPENPSASVVDQLASIKEQIAAVLATGAMRPVFVGGDHTLPYATVTALSERLGRPLALLHVDAHPDLNNAGDPDFIDDSTFFYDVARSGHIDPDRSLQLYLRQDLYTIEDNSDVADRVRSVDALTMKSEFRRDGFEALVREIEERVGDAPVYISFDIDAVDCAFAPGTTFPMPCGATSEELFTLFASLGRTGIDFHGGEVVEVIPDLDAPTKTTCILAAVLLRDFAILAARSAAR
jgi:agmatinase